MKLRYLFSTLLASALMFAGCQQEGPAGSFENISLDATYLTIPAEGGQVTLTVEASEDWQIDTLYNENVWPHLRTAVLDESGSQLKDENGNKVYAWEPSWLALEGDIKGSAGTAQLVFTAGPVDGGRELELKIQVGSNSQFFRVRQGSLAAVESTCQEVLDGPDGKTYRIKGKCISIANTTYGNWYINDGSAETDVYIYGTLDADGKTKNFESLGIEVGDIVEVEGPKLTYGSTVELVDVTVIKITKAMLSLPKKSYPISKDGGDVTVKVAYKGDGVYVNIPEDYREWITFVTMDRKAGTPTKIDKNPADTALVTFNVLGHNGTEARIGEVEFTSHGDRNSTTETVTINQEPAVLFIETFATDLGDFTMDDVTLPSGSTYVWKYDDYGYAKASAYVGGAQVSESWLISPVIDLTSAEDPVLVFTHAGNYFNGSESTYATLWTKVENGEWEQQTIPSFWTKGWEWVDVTIDLAAYAGKKMQFAFKYTSTTECTGTWEIKDVMVK